MSIEYEPTEYEEYRRKRREATIKIEKAVGKKLKGTRCPKCDSEYFYFVLENPESPPYIQCCRCGFGIIGRTIAKAIKEWKSLSDLREIFREEIEEVI